MVWESAMARRGDWGTKGTGERREGVSESVGREGRGSLDNGWNVGQRSVAEKDTHKKGASASGE